MKSTLLQYFNDFNVRDVSFDSRVVKKGDVFFAIKGEKFDGNDYIEKALEQGANLIITDNKALENKPKKIIHSDNIRLALSLAAGIFYPELPANLIAVTGTNGKTSVVSYIYQMLSLLGKKSASIGTIGVESSEELSPDIIKLQPKYFTTADPISFRKLLSNLAKEGVDHVAFEASSIGIEQERLGDIKVKSTGFTSFSQDHLEYHKTMEEYLNQKLRLFSEHLEDRGNVVLSSEMNCLHDVLRFLEQKGRSFCAVGKSGNINILKTVQNISGQEVEFEYMFRDFKFTTSIIGSFQASNLLIAAKLVNTLGFDFADIIKLMPQIKAVKGRLQRVTDLRDDFQVFTDYAHTPDALEKSLQELKSILPPGGKLFVIFGCGGDRDKTKRPIMGDIACQIADQVIITDDNPRSENPAQIRKEVIGANRNCQEIDDREEAIKNTIANLHKSDILLIAGKGHEDYQIIGDKVLDFSDVEVAIESLKNKK